MSEEKETWRSKMVHLRWPWGSRDVRPADISEGLSDILLARENTLEDAYYHKIVPNRYVVELNKDVYLQYYESLRQRLVQQWIQRLLDQLVTANSRLGQREYSFGGPVQIELRPADDLQPQQARLLFQIQSSTPAAAPRSVLNGACLELSPGRRRWPLHEGDNTIGRYPTCDVHLDMPDVQELRMVSGVHATLRCAGGEYQIFDGVPSGKPSRNGTYVNYQLVPPGGVRLQHGDFILLAAVDPLKPRPASAGSAAFYFYLDCSQ
jgi:hypothetical protein